MQGVYLVTDRPPDLVFAGFVAGVGWAHEQAADRGIVEALLRALADPAGVAGVRAEVFVSAVNSSLVLAGPPEQVEAAGTLVARRLLGQQPFDAAPTAPSTAPADADVLWRRWGAQSYGVLGLTPYALAQPAREELAGTTRQMFNAATLVPFGVDCDVMALLEHLPQGQSPALPPVDPIVALPAQVTVSGGLMSLSWVSGPEERLADVIIVGALATCFARPTPDREAVAVSRRDLGTAGRHTTLRLVGRGPQPDEVAAVVTQLRRLRDEGPTEAEIVQALDLVGPPKREAPVSAALRLAWQQLTGVPQVPVGGWGDPTEALRSVLSQLLVVSGEVLALGDLAPQQSTPVDTDRLPGRTFRVAKLVTAGNGLEGSRLTVGAQGLSWRRARRRETIRAQDVAVIEVWNDDDRSVLSRYGYRMHLDPLDWRRWERLRAEVDALALDRVRATGVRHPGVRSALPQSRFVDFERVAPYMIAGLGLVFTVCALMALLNADLTTRDRVLAPLLLLCLGGFLCHHMWSIMVAVRRRRRRAQSPGPTQVPLSVPG